MDLLLLLALATTVSASNSALAEICPSWNSTRIICMNRYASLMPYHFFRNASYDIVNSDQYSSTVVNDTSFSAVATADFLVFDQERAAEILGASPSLEFMFELEDNFHEGTVYIPELERLYVTPVGTMKQLMVDMSVDPPTIEETVPDPPLFSPTGAGYYKGLVYYCVNGGVANETTGYESRPGLYTFDPKTGKSAGLLNNYFGYYFNTCDDLAIAANGDIWFSDPSYSWSFGTDDTAPQLATGVYRYRPSTGAVSIVEDSLVQPNGIAITPQQDKLYLTDTGAGNGPIDGRLGPIADTFNATGPRSVYAYDISEDGMYISNKRPLYRAIEYIPDGLKVANNGYVVTATGHGIDVLDPAGTLLVRVQTNISSTNFVWTGEDRKDLWISGRGGLIKVKWELQGQELI